MAAKERRKAPSGAPKYHRLTMEDRIIIQTLRIEGRSCRYIAEKLGCRPSTVSRELSRNKSRKGYRAKKAQAKADWRARRKAAARRKLTPEMWGLVKARMSDGWMPEQIEGLSVVPLRPLMPPCFDDTRKHTADA